MGLFDDVRKSLMDLVTILPKLNRENRDEIRSVVLQLQSEMERSVTLATLYLDGVSRIKPKQELLDHLYHAPQKLLESYNEYKICAGLYGLADRFDQWFSSLPASINATEILSVKSLIGDLGSGERLVIDGLRNTTALLSESARELDQLEGDDFEDRKAALYARTDMERNELLAQIDSLRRTVQDLLKRM